MDRYKSIFITFIMLTCVIAQSSPELSIKITADSIYVNNEFCYKTKDLYNSEIDWPRKDTTSQLYSKLVTDNSDSTVSLLHYPNMPFDIYWKICRYLSKSSTNSIKVSSFNLNDNVTAFNLLSKVSRKKISKKTVAFTAIFIGNKALTLGSSGEFHPSIWYKQPLVNESEYSSSEKNHESGSDFIPKELTANTWIHDTIHEPLRAFYHKTEQGYIVDSNGVLTDFESDSSAQYYVQKLGHIDTCSRKLLKNIEPSDIEIQNISSYNLLKVKLLKILNDFPNAPDRKMFCLVAAKDIRVEISSGIIIAAQEVGYELFWPTVLKKESENDKAQREKREADRIKSVTRSEENMLSGILRNREEIYEFNNSLKRRKQPEGQVVLKIGINGYGRVVSVYPESISTITDTRFIGKITDIVYTWDFGAIENPKDLAFIRVPFIFK